jgi:energy-coupling factor transporter ATP-binding protein EcfA2
MFVKKIQVRNILGIKTLEVNPGKITTIAGKNGTGKTSFLEAIKGILGGGHDGTLLRKGEEEGEIVLVLDNGETLTKKMTSYKSDVILEGADGKKIKKAASYLKEIIDPVGLNPIQILTADPKTRIKMLLNSVPMPMPTDEIKYISGLDRSDKDGHPLHVIDEIRKDIFEERAYVNKKSADSGVMVSELRKTVNLFNPDKKDWAIEVGVLRTELEGLVKSHDKDVVKAQADTGNKQNALREDATKKRQEADKIIAEIQADLNEKLTEEREAFQGFVDKRRSEYEEESGPVKEKITVADQNSKNQQKISGTMETVDRMEKEINLLEKEAKDQSLQIDDLDKLKGELMSNLPVKGLTVYDSDIYIDDIPFDTLNEASRIKFCLMIAGLRKTKLPLVCVDGLEALDEEVFKVFKEEAEKTDMQFFVTRVTEDEDLTLN